MSEFRKGFLLVPKKQQSRVQQSYEERNNYQKSSYGNAYVEGELWKQLKSDLYQEISQFNSSDQMSMQQFIKVVLKSKRKRLRNSIRRTKEQLKRSSTSCKILQLSGRQTKKVNQISFGNTKENNLARRSLKSRKSKSKIIRLKTPFKVRNTPKVSKINLAK